MGRPPIGKRAMTGVERQRRRREKIAAMVVELAKAKARIVKLEARCKNQASGSRKSWESI
jgi:hypothetical protein